MRYSARDRKGARDPMESHSKLMRDTLMAAGIKTLRGEAAVDESFIMLHQ